MTTIPASSSRSNSRLLFASCNSQHYKQVLWPNILHRQASAFVWGGDAIYGDAYEPATPSVLKKCYETQREHPHYKQLLETGIPVMGVLDDHDFGINDGDKTFPYRTESGVLFACEFLKNAGTMCERAKKGYGAYGVQVMDFDRPKGDELLTEEEAGLEPDMIQPTATTLGDKTVAIFLLDIRSNRTPYTRKFGPEMGDYLGESQWQWLEKALQQSTAAVNLIVTGIQVLADRQAPAECWSRYPNAQHRLYQTILQSNAKVPIIVSGDVHHAQLLRQDCYQEQGGNKQTLLEITTSGMTHSWGSKEQCARPFMSRLCRNPFYSWVLGRGMHFAQYLNGYLAWTELIRLASDEVTEEGTAGLQFTLDRNFAEMDFNWEERSVTVRVLGEDIGASPLLSHKWALDELSSPSSASRAEGQWSCQNYRGVPNPTMRVLGLALPILGGLVVFLSPFFLLLWILLIGCKRWLRQPLKAKKS